MPEGHVLHRLARDINTHFANRPIVVSSPQGRFDTTQLKGLRIAAAQAHGKQLFIHFATPEQLHAAGAVEGKPTAVTVAGDVIIPRTDTTQAHAAEVPDAAAGTDAAHTHAAHAAAESMPAVTPRAIIHIHLGLIGTFRFEDPLDMNGQIRLRLATPDIAAHLRGPQWCRIITEPEYDKAISNLGADPLIPDEDPTGVLAKAHRSNKTIASLLMDQKLFAGVGNIYRAEVLFRQHLSPFATGREVDTPYWQHVWDDLVQLMEVGVARGRIDTVDEQHTPEAMGRAPRKDDHGGEVYVYRRAGQPCYVCGALIEMVPYEGRNLFYCPGCQTD